MPYTSHPGGLFDSGIYPDSSPRIDVGSLLTAVGAGTGSIIHAIMQRKLAEHEQATNDAQLQMQRDAARRQGEQQTWERGIKERELSMNETQARQRALVDGIVPETPDVDQTTTRALPGLEQPQVAPRVSPIRQVLSAADTPVQSTPRAPDATTVQQHDVRIGSPEHYDPTQSAVYVRQAALQDAKAEAASAQQRERLNSQMAMKVYSVEGAKAIAKIRANATTTAASTAASSRRSASPIHREMTQGQAESMRFKVAQGLLDHAGGSYDTAVDFLNSEDGKALRAQGIEPRHLMWARSEITKARTNAAMHMQTGGVPMVEPEEAVAAVDKTTNLVSGKPPANSAQVPPGAKKDTGNVALPNKAPTSLNKPPTIGITEKRVIHEPDDFTDDEIADALNAGKSTQADVAAFIKAKRKSKKKP